MKKCYLFIFLVIILGACGQQDNENNNNTSYIENDKGTIVYVEDAGEGFIQPKEGYRVLVIPDIEDINIIDQTKDELIKLAQENDGAFYNVDTDMYEELDLDIGTQIVAYYEGEGESDPPVRFAEKIEVISQQ